MTDRDKSIAKAAIELFRAVKVSAGRSSVLEAEGEADACIVAIVEHVERFDYCSADDTQAIACFVYDVLELDHSKIH